MRQQDRIYTALELLFFASRTAQNAWLLHADIPMSNESWAIDFCTIKLKGPRKCGHTSAVAKLVREHLKTVVLITPMPKDHGLTNTKQLSQTTPMTGGAWI